MPHLDTLLNLIHAQGIPVGAAERLRLQQILNAQPQLSGVEFRELLGTVLAKNEDQRQRIVFIFERFTRDLDVINAKQNASLVAGKNKDQEVEQTRDDRESTRVTRSNPKQQKNYLPWIVTALAIITITLLLAFLDDKDEIESKPTEIPINNPTTTSTKTKVEYQPKNQDKPLIKDLPVWSIEKITIKSRPIMQEFIPPFLLFLGSTVGFLWLLSKVVQRTRRRQPKPILYQQITGYHTPPVKHAFYKLFNAQDRQTLSWGVGHYFDQDQQNRIDIDRSVTASANEGFPVIEFEQSRYEREVWIWQDRLNQSPIQSQMIREIKQVLDQANIHVKHGFFNGTPYQITDRKRRLHYQVIGALPQPVPLVLLCLDANNVNAHFRQSPNETAQVFQHLKQWSTLAVVDCNPSVSSLKQTLNDYHIPYLLPAQVADWFAKQGTGALRRKVCVLDDFYRWACACALAQRIITEDEAYALHEALGLNCAWQYSHLNAYGRPVGAGLDFSNTVIERINDLTDDDRTLATQFWRSRFKQIDQDLSRGKDYPNWKNSHSRYTDIKIPTALLGLWEQSPEPAINALQDYAENNDLKHSVREALARYSCKGLTGAPADKHDAQQYIQLPHEWKSLTPQVQQQLLSMGFAGYEKQLSLTPDKLSSLFMAGLAGLMCYTFYQCILVFIDKPPVVQTRLNSATPPALIEYNNAGRIYLGTARNTLSDMYKLKRDNQPQNDQIDLVNKRIEVSWSRTIIDAQESIASEFDPTKKAQLWRLGTRRYPPARDGRIAASHAFIEAEPENVAAQALAIQLLDSGSADQVLVSNKPTAFQPRFREWIRFPGDEETQVQRIIISNDTDASYNNLSGIPNTLIYSGDLNTLLSQFAQTKAGEQSTQQLQELGFAVTGKPFLRLLEQASLSSGQPILLDHGIKLIPIPAGSFEMGSNEGDDDEKPVHTVTIKQAFWMSDTEVTFDQYDAYVNAQMKKLPDDEGWGRKDRPVINVSWQEAVDYTSWLTRTNSKGMTCRLPSEAEWEYAARGRTKTKFYWGDDGEDVAREHANFSGTGGSDTWSSETAPVKQFKPNDFGLFDMSGNVWEWTQDKWHDNYQGAPEDGSAWESGSGASRVLRGGSWGLTSNFVRSAGRSGSVGGSSVIGFRAVCYPSNILAETYEEQGQYSKAALSYLRALAASEKTFGKNHPDTVKLLNSLGRVYTAQGRYDEALILYQRALSINESSIEEEEARPEVAVTLSGLAGLYIAMGEYSKAEPLYIKALNISEKILKKGHPDTARVLIGLAELYMAMGEYPKAEPLYLQALNISYRVLGKDHPDTVRVLIGLAGLYMAMGEYSKAEPLYLQALNISDKILGKNHSITAKILSDLADLYQSSGKTSMAMGVMQRAVNIYEQLLPPNHPDLIKSRKILELLQSLQS